MVYFRKRFPPEAIERINDAIAVAVVREKLKESDVPRKSDPPPAASEPPREVTGSRQQSESSQPEATPANQGKLIVDATCTPADVASPTDPNLLNRAREKAETIIDILHILHGARQDDAPKPRTYRKKARKKRPGRTKIRKAIGQQLRFLRRNLEHIDTLAGQVPLSVLPIRRYRALLVISELYRQQKVMYERRVHSIDDRIVSISQPHIRPIKRGKVVADTEFGTKVSTSLVHGVTFTERINWDNFKEGTDLIDNIKKYKKRFGVYPASAHADKIYRNRDNLRYCRTHGIRLSGPPLGRPRKVTPENREALKAARQQIRQDELDRIPVEGKFGQGKRRFGLGRIMAKLAGTGAIVIALNIPVMNLEKLLKTAVSSLLFVLWNCCIKPLHDEIRRFSAVGSPFLIIRELSLQIRGMSPWGVIQAIPQVT